MGDRSHLTKGRAIICGFFCAALALLAVRYATADDDHRFKRSILPLGPELVSLGEARFGAIEVAFVPEDFPRGGPLSGGDILVSGSGGTIVNVKRNLQTSIFFQGRPGLGLNAALGVLVRGFVLVGNLPSGEGNTFSDPGSVLVIDRRGNQVMELADPNLLDGPFGFAIFQRRDRAAVFISAVLNGTVTRLDLAVSEHGISVKSATRIASGHSVGTAGGQLGFPGGQPLGPTGLAYDNRKDLLYVASTADNKIYAIANAQRTSLDGVTGPAIYANSTDCGGLAAGCLHGPVGLVLAPNGDLLTSNDDLFDADATHPSEIVEFTPAGRYVTELSIEPFGRAAFGIGFGADKDVLRFAAVDGFGNTLDLWKFDNPMEER